MRFILLRHVTLWATLPVASFAHAAASLLVDDAGTTPDGQCQLESWGRRQSDHHALAVVPACTFGGTEWSLGLDHLHGGSSTLWAVAAKRTLRGHDDERLQFAASIGIGGDLRHAGTRGWTANLPASVRVDTAGRLVVHVNVGWEQGRLERGITSGIGSTVRLAAYWSLLAEHWRDAAHDRSSQIGLRRHLRGDASLDLLAGRVHGDASSSWVTVGLNVPLSH